MTLPATGTTVTYPTGATEGTGTVLHVEPAGERFAVLLDVTPCHPVDAAWPDQPADRATLTWNGGTTEVADAVVAAFEVSDDEPELFLGDDVPVRKGTEGWIFVVAHLVPEAPPDGVVVTVEVEPKRRRALSTGHTACHLASLALDRALAGRWRKEIPVDTLGAPNFEAEANESSRILERGAHDTYRLGKSLRKRGFTVEGLADELGGIQDAVNATLADWVASNAEVRIDREGELLTDRREWVCALPEGEARIPCGGTHATRLGELAGLTVSLSLAEVERTPVLTMETHHG